MSTTVISSEIAVPNRTQITCKHCLTTPVALPCTVPVFPLLLPCGMILACLHFLHTESFTLLNSCSNATIPLLLPIYLLFSMNYLTGTLPATVPQLTFHLSSLPMGNIRSASLVFPFGAPFHSLSVTQTLWQHQLLLFNLTECA